MNPIVKHDWTPEELTRQGIRGIEAFTAEELALLQQKVEGWLRQRGTPSRNKRRPTSFVIRSRTADPN
jgi:hypothetical protein